jgi:Flp pilus assembly protein TadG
MERKFWPKENGQTAVIIAVLLIVLLAFAGLAIDGGMSFLDRRRMQNAADSSSLAGARRLAQAMCDRTETAQAVDAAIWSEIVSYAQSNGVLADRGVVVAHYVHFNDDDEVVEFSPAVVVGSGTVPNGAVGVIVTPTITQSTYFMGLIGISNRAASAQAVAVAGPPLLIGGMRPFGVPIEAVQALAPGQQFSIVFSSGGGTVSFAGQTSQHHGWMNMGYVWNQGEDPNFPRALDQSTGASTIEEWVKNGWDGTLYADCKWADGCRFGDYIHAKPGVMGGAVTEIGNIDETFYAPVFDVSVDCVTQVPAPKPACPSQGSGYVYHIVGFVGVNIISVDTHSSDKTVNLSLNETIIGQGQASPNPGYQSQGGVPHGCELMTLVVSLWE